RDGDVDPPELVARRRVGIRGAGARVHRRARQVRAPGDRVAVNEAVRVRGDRGERRTAAGPYVGRVEAVGSVVREVVLDRRREAADADRGEDPRGAAAHVRQLEPGDVLASADGGSAGPGPVRAAVVGDEDSLLRAGDDLAAVVRVDAHFADGVVLRELA